MAEDINSVTIIGRLCTDAELSYTNSGSAKTKGSIAVKRSRKDGDQWIEEASFFNFELWGRRGESLNQYLSKGTRISISGSLKQDRWEKDGQKHSRVYIHCDKIQLLGGNQDKQGNNQQNNNYNNNSRPSGGQQQGNNQRNNQYPSNNGQGNNSYKSYPSGGGSGNFEDDIPFMRSELENILF